MASTIQKWLIGCGIGCALIVVVIVVLVGGAAVFIRDKFHTIQEASNSRHELVAKYGAPDAFVPPPDGVMPRERIEIFLSVRDSLKSAQDRLDAGLATFNPERLRQKKQSFRDVLGMLNDMSSLITPIGEYLDRRNRALLEKGMSLGEYIYLYTISYHSWLRHAPEDGPPVFARMRVRDREGWSEETVRRQYRQLILRLLRNQLDGIKVTEETKWRRAVEQEIDRVDRDFERVAWCDDFPVGMEESLRPFRTRLEAGYHPSSNCFELLTLEESRQFQWNY